MTIEEALIYKLLPSEHKNWYLKIINDSPEHQYTASERELKLIEEARYRLKHMSLIEKIRLFLS